MIVTEQVTIRNRLFDYTYSDQGYTILQIETGVEYDEAYDLHPTQYTYEETENKKYVEQ